MKKQKKCNGTLKEEGKKPRAEKKDQEKVAEEPPTGYIHVRARRGQATDSHSLAERVQFILNTHQFFHTKWFTAYNGWKGFLLLFLWDFQEYGIISIF